LHNTEAVLQTLQLIDDINFYSHVKKVKVQNFRRATKWTFKDSFAIWRTTKSFSGMTAHPVLPTWLVSTAATNIRSHVEPVIRF